MKFLLNPSRAPPSAKNPLHRIRVIRVYRGILKQARSFFDDTTRDFIAQFAQLHFRYSQHDLKHDRVRKKLRNALTNLHQLERANQLGKYKDVMSVLEFGYGRRGPRRMLMLKATAGIGKREEIFGNLDKVARYRPAFFAIAQHEFGRKKLEVPEQMLKSRHPLNVAKMQDKHWKDNIRQRLMPPVDRDTMRVLEQRASTGQLLLNEKVTDPRDRELLERWTQRWAKTPHTSQIIRYYRALLQNITMIEEHLASPTRFTFYKSSLAGRKPPSSVNIIDTAGL